MSTETPDDYHGIGGSYTLDPATGKRTLIERTQESGSTPPPTDKKPTPKDKE